MRTPRTGEPRRLPTMSARAIYADYAASAPLRPGAAAALTAALRHSGNPSSAHRAGAEARAVLEEAREVVAEAIGARPLEIVFTSGATEANNLALCGIAAARDRRLRLVVPATEHSSVLAPARALEAAGHALVVLPVNSQGRVDSGAVAAAAPGLLSVGLVNAETGVVEEVPALARVTRRCGGLVHVDAAQAATTVALDVDALGADLLTLSARKVGGPPGAGALYVRRELAIRGVLHGGPQERGLRPGSENVPAIAGFAAALSAAVAERVCEAARLARLTAVLRAGIVRHWPAARFVDADGGAVAPHVVHVTLPGVTGEALVAALDLEGVQVSAGSACAAGAAEPSHVLRAMGRGADEARQALRLSLGWATTESEIAELLARLGIVLRRARAHAEEAA